MTNQLFTLAVDKLLSPSLSQRTQDELPLLIIAHPNVRAAVALQGAHLLAWQPRDEKPVIWLSKNTLWKKGKAIRGGVPVCWPWFGPADEPAHGFARNMPWVLTAHNETSEGVSLTLLLENNVHTKALWPHDFKLYAHFHFTQLRCEVELEAEGEYQSTGALHSYFSIDNIHNVAVSGLGKSYIDKVEDGAAGTAPDGTQHYANRVDRIYTAPQECSLIEDQTRIIEVHHQHHSDVVTWNPGPALSASMSDMEDNGYQTMVCVETARLFTPLKSSLNRPARLGMTVTIRHHTP